MNKHWCHNRKPFKETLMVQDGWTADGRRVMKEIPFSMSSECEYDMKQTDAGCDGCVWNEE